jgi:hypothetical protein
VSWVSARCFGCHLVPRTWIAPTPSGNFPFFASGTSHIQPTGGALGDLIAVSQAFLDSLSSSRSVLLDGIRIAPLRVPGDDQSPEADAGGDGHETGGSL